jgi:CRISPR-associated endonuclease/helicase Cas3
MLYSYNLKSHSDKPLVIHLKNVGIFSEKLIKSKEIQNKQILADIARLIGVTHDLGKATTYFQDLLTNGRKSQKAQHGLLSSLLAYQVVRAHLSSIGRLEEFQYLSVIAWVVVKKHHGNIQNLWGEESAEATTLTDLGSKMLISEQIRNIKTKNLTEIQQIFAELIGNHLDVVRLFEEIEKWDALTKEIRAVTRKMRNIQDTGNYFTMLLLYSVLLDSDKMDAANLESPLRITDLEEDIVDSFKEKSFKINTDAISTLREQAYVDIMRSLPEINLNKDRLLSINLPTGIGKTLAGFSFALKLRHRVEKEADFVPRIIYCLPFLSIIDQNSYVLNEVLKQQYNAVPSNLFLKHHHLSDVSYTELKDAELKAELNPIEDLKNRYCLQKLGTLKLLLLPSYNSSIVSLLTKIGQHENFIT